MSKRDFRLFLYDILESVERIKKYTLGMKYEDFEADDKTIDAVLRNLEIIGEAARNVPEEIRDKYPEVPWRRLVGLRNVVIHHYFGVDLEVIWKIVSRDLKDLEGKIRRVLSSELDAV